MITYSSIGHQLGRYNTIHRIDLILLNCLPRLDVGIPAEIGDMYIQLCTNSFSRLTAWSTRKMTMNKLVNQTPEAPSNLYVIELILEITHTLRPKSTTELKVYYDIVITLDSQFSLARLADFLAILVFSFVYCISRSKSFSVISSDTHNTRKL